MTDLEFQSANEERIRLIHQKYKGPPMTQCEVDLLERLHVEVGEYIENKFRPYTKDPDAIHPAQQESQP